MNDVTLSLAVEQAYVLREALNSVFQEHRRRFPRETREQLLDLLRLLDDAIEAAYRGHDSVPEK